MLCKMEQATQANLPSASTTIPSDRRAWQSEQRPTDRNDETLRNWLAIFTRYLLRDRAGEKLTGSGPESSVLVLTIRFRLTPSSLRPPILNSCNRVATGVLRGRQGFFRDREAIGANRRVRVHPGVGQLD